MNNLTTIEPIVRILINDDITSMTDVFSYTSSSVFTLTEKNAIEVTEVLVNGIESGVTYTSDITTGKVTITSDLVFDDIIQINYTAYPNYSTSELYRYIKAALVHLSVNNITTFRIVDMDIYPVPTNAEVNLIAMIAGILINPANISYRLPDISVSVPKELPTNDKIRKIIALYKKNCTGFMFVAEDVTQEYPY